MEYLQGGADIEITVTLTDTPERTIQNKEKRAKQMLNAIGVVKRLREISSQGGAMSGRRR